MNLDAVPAAVVVRSSTHLAHRACVAVLATAIALSSGCAPDDSSIFEAPESLRETTSELYQSASAMLWPNGRVPICFATFGTSEQAGWVKWALANTWSSVAKIDFEYSSTCPFPGKTNYIQLTLVNEYTDDAGVHTINNFRGLGGSSGLGVGSPTFAHFGFCKFGTCTENCPPSGCGPGDLLHSAATFQAGVVHELGHALGLVHEHQRTDAAAPTGCLDPQPARADYPTEEAFQKALAGWNTNVATITNGITLTPYYDPDSIMNYCRGWRQGTPDDQLSYSYKAGYFAPERLSPGDAYGASRAYGARFAPWLGPVLL